MPVPGWTAEYEWDGFIPPEELPWGVDPARGFLATANNRIHDDAYPYLIGHDFHTPFRVRRIAELLAASDAHDVASMSAIQNDTVSLASRTTLPLLLSVAPDTPETSAALELLRGWDGDMAADSAAAAVFNVWSRHIARRILEPWLGEDLFRHYHAWREDFQCEVLPALLRARPNANTWTTTSFAWRSAMPWPNSAPRWARIRLGGAGEPCTASASPIPSPRSPVSSRSSSPPTWSWAATSRP